jgi:protocatechuate 3,4-dioxygenase, beta subunit
MPRVPIQPTRRSILKTAAFLAVGGTVAPFGRAWAQTSLRRTPDQILGPFYPITNKQKVEGVEDLTHVPGGNGRANGQLLNVSGRVLTTAGEPVPGVRMEIWQANAAGRYAHPDDTNSAPLDPNFLGYTVLMTGADGSYRFETIKPGAYPAGPNTIRPAHIHYDLSGTHDRLVTQMYFEGDPYNEKDRFLQSVLRPEALIVKLRRPVGGSEADPMLAVFDIVIRG